MAQDSEKSQHDDVVEVTRLKEHDVVISKPMGMILTEISEDDPTAGVCILSIDPNGSTAKYNIACIAKGEVQRVICLEDRILAVQGERCETETFEQVIHRISQMNPSYDDKGIEVKLTLGRLEEGSVIQWPNGVCICCRSGDSLGLAAYKAKVPIKYSCSSGSCGTCEQQIILTSGETRYVRPCMARVPRGEASIRVTKSDRYEPMM